MESIGVDFVDESEVLTSADDVHIDKSQFSVPFVCGCHDLGEALRRIQEGAAMIRTKGEAGTGNVFQAVKHARLLNSQLLYFHASSDTEKNDMLYQFRVSDQIKFQLTGPQLPVVAFAAGGIATPADAALLMQMGMDGVFVGSVQQVHAPL